MSTHVGDIFINAKLDDKQYQQGLKKLQTSAGVAGNAIGKKLTRALSVAGLTAFANKCLSLNSTFHAVSDMAGMAFPNMSDQVDAFAKSAMASFGLSETSALKFASTFGTMANSLGIAEDKAWTMSENLAALAGDMASFYHLSQDEAFTKLQSVFSGETESLKRLGIMMTQANLEQFAMNQGYAVAYKNMDEASKAMVRYNYVLSATTLAQGDAAKYANAYGNQILRLKQNFQSFQIALGEGFRSVVTPILQWLNALMQKLIQVAQMFSAWIKMLTGATSWVKSLGGAIKGALGKATTKQTDKAASSIENVGSNLGGAGKAAKGAKKAVQSLKRELLGFDQIVKLTKQDSATGTGGAGGISGIGSGDLGALADINLDSYTSSIDKLQEALNNIQIPERLQAALDKLGDAFSKFFGVLKDFGAWCFENVLKPLGKWFAESALPPILESIASVISIISDALEILGMILKPLWENVLKPLFSFLGDVAVGILEGIAGMLDWLAEKTEALKNKIKSGDTIWQKAIDKMTSLRDAWKDLKAKIGNGVVTAKVALTDAFSSVWTKVQKVWKTAYTTIGGKVATAKLALTDAFSSVWNKVKSAWNSIGNKKATITLSFTDKMKSLWNSLAQKVQAARNKSEFAKKILPNMPYLAEGGWVKKNTPMLAVIGDNPHEGEVVAPESKLREMAMQAAGAGNQQVITLLMSILQAIQSQDTSVYLDGKEISRNTVQHINRETRRTGKLSIIV